MLLVMGALVVAAAALPVRAEPGNAPAARRRALQVGQAAPPLSVDRVRGDEAVTLDGLAGRVIVLDFWATWCAPCRAVMPALDALYQRHREAGLSVVGLSPESAAIIRSHLDAQPVSYTVARDVGGTLSRYGIRVLPTLVVLDRAGQVREVMVGVDSRSLERLERLVGELLAQPAP